MTFSNPTTLNWVNDFSMWQLSPKRDHGRQTNRMYLTTRLFASFQVNSKVNGVSKCHEIIGPRKSSVFLAIFSPRFFIYTFLNERAKRESGS